VTRARLVFSIAFAIAAAGGCATSHDGAVPAPGTTMTASTVARLQADTAPTWRPGDRWAYVFTSGSEKRTKTIEVREVKPINGVRYYIVRNTDAEADQYWTMDLHWAASVRDAKVQARMVPPEPWFTWPLRVGQQWQHRGEFQQIDGKQQTEDTFVVVGSETVEVPAGTFEALKITRTTKGGDSDQYWYVPEVRTYVRWIGRRGTAEFEERLSEYGGVRRGAPVAPEQPRPLR
jgi:hypothetical protein